MHSIASAETREAAHRRVDNLLAEGHGQQAIDLARSVVAAGGWIWARDELLGIALIDGGQQLGATELVADGVLTLRDAFADPGPHTAYNIANGENALWEIPLRAHGVAVAMVSSRDHLHAARRTFETVGALSDADPALRVQALVNAANSYDNLGRDLDALALWDRALEIDPSFAMAHGNRGIALAHTTQSAGEHQPRVASQAGGRSTSACRCKSHRSERGRGPSHASTPS